MKEKLIQGITLSLFLSLIVGFVSFRAGFLGTEKSAFYGSPNGTVLNNQTDSISKAKQNKLLPSSKMLTLNSYPTSLLKDSIKKPLIDTSGINKILLYSTKAGPIIISKDLQNAGSDSIAQDTVPKPWK